MRFQTVISNTLYLWSFGVKPLHNQQIDGSGSQNKNRQTVWVDINLTNVINRVVCPCSLKEPATYSSDRGRAKGVYGIYIPIRLGKVDASSISIWR